MIASEGALDRIRLHGIASSSKLMGQSNRYGDKAGVGRLAHAGMRDLDSAKVKNRIELHTIHAPNPEPKELAGTHRAEVLREMLAEFRREFTDVIGAEQVILQIEEPGKAPYNIIADALIRYTDADGNVRYHIGEAKLSQIRGLTGNLSKEQLYSTLTDGQRSGFSAIVNRVEGLEIRILGKTKIEVVFDLAAQKPDGARYYQSENPIRVDPEISIRTRSHENGADGSLDTSKWVDTVHSLQELAWTIDRAVANARSTCFAPETPVHTNTGVREIQYIQPGTWVLSRSEITGEQAYRRVVRKFVHEPKPEYLVQFTVPDEHEGGHLVSDGLFVTAEHPFWVRGLGWVEAANLQVGQELEVCDPDGRDDGDRRGATREEFALSGQRWVATVKSVKARTTGLPVHNLEVEDFHTYFVGCFGVWVHNKNLTTPITVTLVRSTPERVSLGPDKFKTKIPENGNAIDIRSARTEIESATQRNSENCAVGVGNTPSLDF